jgi:hypothetical protein
MSIKNVTAQHQRSKENEEALAQLFFLQNCYQTYGEHCMIPVNPSMFTFWKSVGVTSEDPSFGGADVKVFAEHLRLFADLLDPKSP